MAYFNEAYISSRWPEFRRLWLLVAIVVFIMLLLLWLLGYGPGGKHCPVPVEIVEKIVEIEKIVEKPVIVEKIVEKTIEVPAPGKPVAVVGPAVLPEARLYFDMGSAEFPADTELSLATIISYLHTHSGAKAVVSGFHDSIGNYDYNKNLARNRAEAVSALLQEAGIPMDRIEIEKPIETTGTGAPEEARRVEVTIGH